MILSGLGSPEWATLIKALLHTLWQGTVMAGLLGLALRWTANPVIRYWSALGALAGVVAAGVLTWGVLGRPLPEETPAISPVPVMTTKATVAQVLETSELPPVVKSVALSDDAPPERNWTAWLALVWLGGCVAMLGRAGFQVAGAERLRRSARPLEDARMLALLAEARAAIGLARRVRIAVTDKLASPVVAGVLLPTLIIPLSLTTTLSQEQIRFILLHELAHIRRGDYLANLFQLFTEALLFFNPAVWWMSRQVRLEREACCDALAVELSGTPADYARTLLRVVEQAVNPPPMAALAWRGGREPSSLADRVQRMLVPGYRPALRLSWRAMFAALLTGGVLLFLTAVGTRVTIAAILSPQERIQRIEKKMTEYGQNPAIMDDNGSGETPPRQVKIAGSIRMTDGSLPPKRAYFTTVSLRTHSSAVSSMLAKDGKFSDSIDGGTIYLGVEITNFAPVVIGPLDGLATNDFENLEMVFEPGFDVRLQAVDGDSEKLLSGGTVATAYWMGSQRFQSHSWTLAADGQLKLTHCADLPLEVTVNVPGYEIVQKHFDHLRAGETLKVALPRGETISGTVLDRATGRPLAGAKFHLLYHSDGGDGENYPWTDALHDLGTNRADGTFGFNQFHRGHAYYLGVSAAGHESVVLKHVVTGAAGVVAELGPELIVRGHVTGALDQLPRGNRERTLNVQITEVYENNRNSYGQQVPVQITNAVATFEFTNRAAGSITLSGGGYSETREVAAPIDDWVVDLHPTQEVRTKPVAKREVIFRFQGASGVPPEGTVEVTIPDSMETDQRTAHLQEMKITNGWVRVDIAVGGETRIEPKHMVGYWFNPWAMGRVGSIMVTNGLGPLVLDVPVIPAGAIYARARNADGSPAGGLLFGVTELKRAPGRDAAAPLDNNGDNFSSEIPRKWISGPLPLGGTYEVHGWRGNSFCTSQPIKLTEADPDAELALQFPPGKTFHGTVLDAQGKPLRDAELTVTFTLKLIQMPGDQNWQSFTLKTLFTDEEGRFELDEATPNCGTYSAVAVAPGIRAETVDLDFSGQPSVIRLKQGRALSGRLVEAGTGLPIPGEEVRAMDFDNPKLPLVKTLTDDAGGFEFTTLSDTHYTLLISDGVLVSDKKYRADGSTNLLLKATLYNWSRVKPTASNPMPRVTNGVGIRADNQQRPASVAGSTTTANAEARPQIHIKAWFYKAPKTTFDEFQGFLNLTNPADGKRIGILNASDARAVLQKLRTGTGSEELGEPEITTLFGRQAQIRATETITVVTGLTYQEEQTGGTRPMATTETLETGPIFDVLPGLLPDGKTLSLDSSAFLTEFHGYVQFPKGATTGRDKVGAEANSPEAWPEVLTRRESARVNLYDLQTLLMPLDSAGQVHFGAPDTARDAVIAKAIEDGEKKDDKKIMVLVTVTLVTRAGARVHQEEEMPRRRS